MFLFFESVRLVTHRFARPGAGTELWTSALCNAMMSLELIPGEATEQRATQSLLGSVQRRQTFTRLA
jgi:hypothetical protein